MSRKTSPLLPQTEELLRQFGERLRLARLRRKLSAKQVAERAGMTPMTLRSLERGGSGVTIGAYLAVMQVLGIEKELDHIAQADPLGRSLQDSRLTRSDESRRALDAPAPDAPVRAATRNKRVASHAGSSAGESGFISSRDLAALITGPTAHPSEPKTPTRRKLKSKPKPRPRSTVPSVKAGRR
jgi:transcriptional regulator with XRE-family HTH domain